MFKNVADFLFVPEGSTSVQFSGAISMGADNAIQTDVLLISAGSSVDTINVLLQQSDDAENWSVLGSTVPVTAYPNRETFSETSIVSGYVRVRFEAVGGDCLVKASVFTKKL